MCGGELGDGYDFLNISYKKSGSRKEAGGDCTQLEVIL